MSPISILPIDVCNEIWKYFDINTLMNTIMVNKSWQIFTRSHLYKLKMIEIPNQKLTQTFRVDCDNKKHKYQVEILIVRRRKDIKKKTNSHCIVFALEKG